jgi:polar amino acid transport system substrate-binding protein
MRQEAWPAAYNAAMAALARSVQGGFPATPPKVSLMMLRRLLALLLTLLPALAQAATLTLLAPEKLTFGSAISFAPFEYEEDGKYTGFDIDFLAAIAEKMHLGTVPMNMTFAGLIPALQSGRIDLINSSMYITAARTELVLFLPYMKVGNQIIVKKGNPLGINGLIDLCGHRVGVTLGAIQDQQAHAANDQCKAAGKPEITILPFPTAQDATLSVRQGRADAYFDSVAGAALITRKFPDIYQVIPGMFGQTQIGFALRKDDTALHDAMEAALKEVVAEGTYARLMEKYNLPIEVSLF